VAEAKLKMVAVLAEFPNVVEKFDGKFDKLSAYIRLSTRTAMADFFRNDHVIAFPHSQNPPEIEASHPHAFMDETPVEPDETLETLRKCARDDGDRSILAARIDGGTLAETAKLTGFSRNTIRKRLARMRSRYENLTS
jgi:DNA-directed RNA polymerase specialized sigma24 family protein